MQMRLCITKLCFCVALALTCVSAAHATDWWASEVINSNRLGISPYDDPLATLGKPSTWMNNSSTGFDPYAVMMVCGTWNVGLQGEKLITTIKGKTSTLPAGYLTVKFATPIYDDPDNWYGKDFIVFGNGFFAASGSDIYSDSSMEDIIISASGYWEPMPVSVSQDGITWYSYTNGPYADDYAPPHAFAWDWIEHGWLKNDAGQEIELDFTKPIDPTIGIADFDQKTAAQGIDMYRGSGGGTAFDLAGLPIPVDPVTGRKWIQYIRVDGAYGEVDAFARVSHQIAEMSIGEAKKLPDGTRVVLDECAVSAGTYEVGRYCYVQHENRSGGIKVVGRVIERDKMVKIWGDMDTIDGERVILATAAETVKDNQGNDVTLAAKPLGMTNKSVDSGGLSAVGLLVRTWGKVKTVDPATKSFIIDDGSGSNVVCIAPRDADAADPDKGAVRNPNFTPPTQGAYVSVTGISSVIEDGKNGLRLRVQDDWKIENE